ncbi:MAG: response regulator [Planctomycetales bacterium]|nr:response regulator [Planctomycetales bacterium]
MRDERSAVLIVEDNRAMTQVLRFNFERAGFATAVAFDGLEAIRQLEEQNFDLLITDLQMPAMDGGELCRHVRDVMQLKDLPIILCSATGMEVDAAHLVVAYDVNQVFYKPISPQAVVSYARSLLDTNALAPCCR